jgi:sortase A
MMRLRSLLSTGFFLTLVAGIVITSISLQSINQSKAASSVGEFVPSLAAFDSPLSPANAISINKPKRGTLIGTLAIPRLKKTIPVYEGTEVAQLKKGAGHYEKSVLPGIQDNSVIAGHRDSVFSQFGSLKIGDELRVSTYYGKFVYTIKSFRIVKANDRTVIVPTPNAILTLSTCYPFRYIGNAPKRFIVNAELKTNTK